MARASGGGDGAHRRSPIPVAPDRLADVIAERLAAAGTGPEGRAHPVLRVLVDGAPAADPDRLADALVDPLRVLGRPALRVSARWFLRPASLRFERGRTDPDALREDWVDVAALRREVLDRVVDDGRYLPTLWDPDVDRATRADYAAAPPGAVLILDGSLLLGRGLPVDMSVHLRLSEAALARRTPDAEHWTLPAYARYDAEVEPDRIADVVVRMDDPRHPAIRWPPPSRR